MENGGTKRVSFPVFSLSYGVAAAGPLVLNNAFRRLPRENLRTPL